MLKLLSVFSNTDFTQVYKQNTYKTVRTETNIFCFLYLTTKSICNNLSIINLKLRNIWKKKRKKMLIERSMNTWLSFIFSICKGLENVYFICISLCLVWLLWNTLLLHLSNILNTVLPFVMSNLVHELRIDLLILS